MLKWFLYNSKYLSHTFCTVPQYPCIIELKVQYTPVQFNIEIYVVDDNIYEIAETFWYFVHKI